MNLDELVQISHAELYEVSVDTTLAHQKALVRQAQPPVDQPVSPLRRFLLSNLFYTPLAGLLGALTTWLILEPWLDDSTEQGHGLFLLLFPMTTTLIVIFIFISDGIASRRLRGNLGRWLRGAGFTLLFSFLTFIPATVLFYIMAVALFSNVEDKSAIHDIREWPASIFIGWTIWRSLAWALFGIALGLGMNLMRSTKAQRRASVMGGVVGGVLGGLLFDPINRFLMPAVAEGSIMRLVGLITIGLCVGIFVALSESLGREGWVRVRTGPLRGKAFILYHNPTIIGSSPQANIYLFKDPKVAPKHAALHRVGSGYEIAELEENALFAVDGKPVHRRRLVSGDQITIGDTVLDFEERSKRKPLEAVIKEDHT